MIQYISQHFLWGSWSYRHRRTNWMIIFYLFGCRKNEEPSSIRISMSNVTSYDDLWCYDGVSCDCESKRSMITQGCCWKSQTGSSPPSDKMPNVHLHIQGSIQEKDSRAWEKEIKVFSSYLDAVRSMEDRSVWCDMWHMRIKVAPVEVEEEGWMQCCKTSGRWEQIVAMRDSGLPFHQYGIWMIVIPAWVHASIFSWSLLSVSSRFAIVPRSTPSKCWMPWYSKARLRGGMKTSKLIGNPVEA